VRKHLALLPLKNSVLDLVEEVDLLPVALHVFLDIKKRKKGEPSLFYSFSNEK